MYVYTQVRGTTVHVCVCVCVCVWNEYIHTLSNDGL